MSELLSFHSTKFLPPHLTEFVFRTALASSPMRRFVCFLFVFCFVCLFTPPNYLFNRSTKSRALMSTSFHFSPTKNFWSWGASGQGRRSSTRCLPPSKMAFLWLVDCPTQLIYIWIVICWVGGGNPSRYVAKCLSAYFGQEWAIWTNFFAKYPCLIYEDWICAIVSYQGVHI